MVRLVVKNVAQVECLTGSPHRSRSVSIEQGDRTGEPGDNGETGVCVERCKLSGVGRLKKLDAPAVD